MILNWNDVGITIGAPEGKIGSICFADQNKSDRNQIRAYSTALDSRSIGVHTWANQSSGAVPSLSVCSQAVGINQAEPAYALDIGSGDLNIASGDLRIGGVVQSFGGGTPTLRMFNTTDNSHDDYVGHYTSSITNQINLADTEVIVFFNDSFENSHTVQPYLAMPLLSTVTVGTIYSIRNMCKGRSTRVRTHADESGAQVYIYEGVVDNALGVDLFDKTSNLEAETGKRKLELICITMNSEKVWYGTRIETN